MARIGFIGLGHMGSGMAANLAAKGHDVRAYDLSAEALEKARAAGCLPMPSTEQAVDGADAVVTMLPAGKQVRSVYEGEIFESAPRTALLIDCSTIDIATARAVSAAAAGWGFDMVDAPVSGGIAAAAAGSLTFMVGGSAAQYGRAAPILEAMGKAVIHAGSSGAGQAAKICNNMLLGASMVATCETFLMAQKLGLDPQTFYDIASKSSGQSWSMTSYCPLPGVGPESPADHGYKGGFLASLMLKDLKLALDAAQGAGASVPMGALAESLYQALVNAEGGDYDFSAMIKLLDGQPLAA